MVGYYRAVLTFSEADDAEWGGIAGGFTVQEYQPNAFEVKVLSPKTPQLASPIELPDRRQILHGQNAFQGAGRVECARHGRRFSPHRGSRILSLPTALADWRLENKLSGSNRFSAQGRIDLSAKGTAAVSVTVPRNPKLPQPRRVRFSTEITDLNQQTVAERSEFRRAQLRLLSRLAAHARRGPRRRRRCRCN